LSQNDISVTGELNDTWEIQERMLLLAEKLERGEDIPELGHIFFYFITKIFYCITLEQFVNII
jgi:hypothetical protein